MEEVERGKEVRGVYGEEVMEDMSALKRGWRGRSAGQTQAVSEPVREVDGEGDAGVRRRDDEGGGGMDEK